MMQDVKPDPNHAWPGTLCQHCYRYIEQEERKAARKSTQ